MYFIFTFYISSWITISSKEVLLCVSVDDISCGLFTSELPSWSESDIRCLRYKLVNCWLITFGTQMDNTVLLLFRFCSSDLLFHGCTCNKSSYFIIHIYFSFFLTGYYGRSCTDACHLNPCENEAQCHRKPSSSHGYICDCGDNHYGQYCQHRYSTHTQTHTLYLCRAGTV